jgi:hypothetical protein
LNVDTHVTNDVIKKVWKWPKTSQIQRRLVALHTPLISIVISF